MAKLWNSLSLFVSRLLEGNYFGYNSADEWFESEINKNDGNSGALDFPIWVPIVIFAVIFVAVTIIIVVSVVKARKKTGEFVTKVKDKIQENIEHEKTKDICPYCGTRLKEDTDRCPGCGAQRK